MKEEMRRQERPENYNRSSKEGNDERTHKREREGKKKKGKKRNQSNGKVGIKLRVMVRSGVEQETIVTLFNATVIKFAHILLKIL